jgi:uncharacterized protein (TIGR02444 family)
MIDTAPALPAWAAETRARPEVAAACRRLQQRHRLDVNLLLACCWAGRYGRRLTPDLLRSLEAVTEPWQTRAAAPLAELADWLGARPDAGEPDLRGLHDRIAAAADSVDALALTRLAAHWPAPAGPAVGAPADAIANLMVYFRHLKREPGVADAADLAPLLAAAFGPALRPLDAVWQIQAAGDRPAEPAGL